jgi:hypothetical protein
MSDIGFRSAGACVSGISNRHKPLTVDHIPPTQKNLWSVIGGCKLTRYADDQLVIDDGGEPEINPGRREPQIILSNVQVAKEVGIPLADANIAINALRARGLVNVRGNAKQVTFKGRVLAHVIEHGRLAHSQLNALMQPAADKDVRIACRKLPADGHINITEVNGVRVYAVAEDESDE